jgi:hypothetical protein
MSDGDMEEMIGRAVDKEKRILTLELKVDALEKSIENGLKEIRALIKWGGGIIVGTLGCLEVLLKITGH